MCEVSSGSFVRPSWPDPKSALLFAGSGGWTENIENLARNRFLGFQSNPPLLDYRLELSQRPVKVESESGSGAGYRFGGLTIKQSFLVPGFCLIVSSLLPFVICFRPFCLEGRMFYKEV